MLPEIKEALVRAKVFTPQYQHGTPEFKVVDRQGLAKICQLAVDGDPRFPTIASVHEEGLRLGILEKVKE